MEAALPPAWAPDPDEPVTLDDILAQSSRSSNVEALDNVLSNCLRKLDSKTNIPLIALTAAAHAALLGVFATAVLVLIAVSCTTIIWLVVLRLNARLLLQGASLLRSTFGEESQPRVIDHAPEETDAEVSAANLTSEPTAGEPESQPSFEQSTHSGHEEPLPSVPTSCGALAEDGPVAGFTQILEAPQHEASSLRATPFGGNLAEAKAFLTDATKAQHKKKSQATPRQQQPPLRVGPPAKFSKHAAPPKLQPPAIVAPIPTLPAGFVPPHMRKTLEAHSRAEAEAKKQVEHVTASHSSPQPQQDVDKENIAPPVQTIILTPCPRGGKAEVVGAPNNVQDRPLDEVFRQDTPTVFDGAHAEQTTRGGGAIKQHTANSKAAQTGHDGQSWPSAAGSPSININISTVEPKLGQSKPMYSFADRFNINGSRLLLPAKAPSTKPVLASSASISQWNSEWPLIEPPLVTERHSHGTATKPIVAPSHGKETQQGPHAVRRAKQSSVFGGKAVAAPPGLAKAPANRQQQFDGLLRRTTTLGAILKSSFNESEPRKSLVFPVQPSGASLCVDTENAIDDSDSDDGEYDGSKDGDSKDDTDNSEAEEEDDGEEEEESAAPPTKRTIALQKKEVRSLVKDAWIDREIMRRSVCNRWQAEDYANLARATNKYLARRDELAGLMASGQLNDEDAQVYPILHHANTAPPKRKPSHCEQLITALKKADKAAVAGVRAPPRQASNLEEAQRKMASVHRAREAALAAGDSARLKRCDSKYMAERRALVKVLEEEDESLLDDVYEKYPPV